MQHAMQIPFSIMAVVKVQCYLCGGLIGTMRRETLFEALALKGVVICPECRKEQARYNNLLWKLIDRAENALFHEGASRKIFWLHALLFHFHTIPVESQLKMANEALDTVTAHAANRENGIPSDKRTTYLSCSPKLNKGEPERDDLERWELDRNSVFEGWQGGAWDE